MKWEVVIGLETHAQLSTVSKIFSGASTAFGAAPNTQACAVDIALPGVLPVLNKGSVERAIRFGLAVGANISRRSIFARKNYFYPDLPKGYQISQYELPIVVGGSLTIHVGEHGNEIEKTVQLTRAHLEEDAGKSLHEDYQGATGIDLNRAGTPLLEIVTEPDMRSSAEAVAYAKELHKLVRWIGICDGNMQEGSFRCDANVSVRPMGSDTLGTRREIKNLNSFRFLQQAIDYEVEWQISELEDGHAITQATVLFDPATGKTRMMRTKEDAHDYRYFPDPDLLPLEVSDNWIDTIKAAMPALPNAIRKQYIRDYELSAYDAGFLTQSREWANYFETAVTLLGTVDRAASAKLIANWMTGELSAALNRLGYISDNPISESYITPQTLAQLVTRIQDGTLSGKLAKEVFTDLWNEPLQSQGRTVDAIIAAKGLKQISDTGAIEKIVDDVLAANAQQVADYKAGKEKAFNSLIGQAMKATKGRANPQQVNEILKRKLAP